MQNNKSGFVAHALGYLESETQNVASNATLITGPAASVPQSRKTFASASNFSLQMPKFRWDIETGESLDAISSN